MVVVVGVVQLIRAFVEFHLCRFCFEVCGKVVLELLIDVAGLFPDEFVQVEVADCGSPIVDTGADVLCYTSEYRLMIHRSNDPFRNVCVLTVEQFQANRFSILHYLLVAMIVSCFFEPEFYSTSDQQVVRLQPEYQSPVYCLTALLQV